MELYHDNSSKAMPFLAVAFSVFVFSYIFFYAIDFLPEPPQSEQNTNNPALMFTEDRDLEDEEALGDNQTEDGEAAHRDPHPARIIIDSINLDVSVSNPTSRSIADLDAALLDGAVRHPDSADFANEGHMFILGHSSYLPTVHNLNFRAFNGIQKLTWGDLIRVQSGDTEYVYRVTKSYEVNASVAELSLDHSKERLTLATCDSFGSKDDRFVVDAELIATEPLSQ